MTDILGIGSPVTDIIVAVEEHEIAEHGGDKGGMHLIDAQEFAALLHHLHPSIPRMPGGSAANTTFALARLGLACSFLGKLGHDDHGTAYREAFAEAGGDTTRFKYDPMRASGCVICLVTPDSERTMRTHLGAAEHLAPEDLTAADFAGCRHAHIEGYLLFNPDVLRVVLRHAREAGCRISMDLASFEVVNATRDLLAELLAEYVDIVFANEDEAAAFCGSRSPVVGLDALGALCETAILKVGEQGAWVQRYGKRTRIPALKAPCVVDTTGAGDLWAAGFLYGQMSGCDISTSGALGALLSSHVIRYPGTAMPLAEWDHLRAAVAKRVGSRHRAEGSPG